MPTPIEARELLCRISNLADQLAGYGCGCGWGTSLSWDQREAYRSEIHSAVARNAGWLRCEIHEYLGREDWAALSLTACREVDRWPDRPEPPVWRVILPTSAPAVPVQPMRPTHVTPPAPPGDPPVVAGMNAPDPHEAIGAGPPRIQGSTSDLAREFSCSDQTIRNRARDGRPLDGCRIVKVRDGLYKAIPIAPQKAKN